MPFRSPQGEGRFESASARRLRCPFSFACCTRFVKWIPYVEVRQWRRFERACPDSGATMAVFLYTAGQFAEWPHSKMKQVARRSKSQLSRRRVVKSIAAGFAAI